jgi:hypothetical protein
MRLGVEGTLPLSLLIDLLRQREPGRARRERYDGHRLTATDAPGHRSGAGRRSRPRSQSTDGWRRRSGRLASVATVDEHMHVHFNPGAVRAPGQAEGGRSNDAAAGPGFVTHAHGPGASRSIFRTNRRTAELVRHRPGHRRRLVNQHRDEEVFLVRVHPAYVVMFFTTGSFRLRLWRREALTRDHGGSPHHVECDSTTTLR